MLDVGIADRLRAKGLVVVEIDGWRERGYRVNGQLASFDPRGSVDHHTAGGRNGDAPSLGICINGRADLPGPLCNVLVGRYTNTCYVIAAGRANHAGRGGFRGLAGNSSVYGVERENVGTVNEPWRDDQTDAAGRVHAALIEGCPTPDWTLVCEHKEWAPGRKIDAHTVAGDTIRQATLTYLGRPAPSPLPLTEDDMPARAIAPESAKTSQFVVIGDNLLPVGSTDELGYYQRTGLVAPGPPEVWPDNYFNALKARLAS